MEAQHLEKMTAGLWESRLSCSHHFPARCIYFERTATNVKRSSAKKCSVRKIHRWCCANAAKAYEWGQERPKVVHTPRWAQTDKRSSLTLCCNTLCCKTLCCKLEAVRVILETFQIGRHSQCLAQPALRIFLTLCCRINIVSKKSRTAGSPETLAELSMPRLGWATLQGLWRKGRARHEKNWKFMRSKDREIYALFFKLPCSFCPEYHEVCALSVLCCGMKPTDLGVGLDCIVAKWSRCGVLCYNTTAKDSWGVLCRCMTANDLWRVLCCSTTANDLSGVLYSMVLHHQIILTLSSIAGRVVV